jgi:hypothetical protein
MDIIASHRLGLIEQFEGESLALAGRPQDAVQRAIVCHHVSDMLGHAHVFSLLAAQASLALDEALDRLDRAARRWRWGIGRAERAALAERVAEFGTALRAIDAERCAGLLMAYRLVANAGLGDAAADRLDPALVTALRAVQVARGKSSVAERRALSEAHCEWDARFAERVAQALDELAWPVGRSAPARVVVAWTISAASLARVERRGTKRIEKGLRRSKRMPADFAANPAQAFFKLQRRVVERQRGDDGDHLSPDEAVRLAA